MEEFKTKDFNFNEVINIQNKEGVLLTNSTDVAIYFDKRHDNILRDIESLKKDSLQIEEMFFETEQLDSYERNRKVYLMTKDGFTLLAMGFTGKKALKWKLKYIEAFNRMEKALKDVYHISETALVNNFMNSVEDKLFKSIDERFEKYEENYRPTHANKIDMCNYIKSGLGEDREDGEVELVKQRVLLILNGEAWQDIPYKTLINNMRLIDESIRSVKSFRTKKQVSLFDEIN